MTGSMADGGYFLINTFFNLYLIVVFLRLVFQTQNAYFYNPVTYAVFRLTQPIIRPMQRFIPGYRHIDGAGIVLLILVELAKLLLIVTVIGRTTPQPFWLFIWAVVDIIDVLLSFYFFAVIIRAIMSWFVTQYNSAVHVITLITEPILKPARQVIPPFSGLDLSPLAVLILIHLTRIVLIAPWLQYMRWLTFVGQ